MSESNYIVASDLFSEWRDNVLCGVPPKLFPVGTGELGRLEIGPGLVTLIGGPPGCGKTALVMQLVVDALRLTPSLRVVVVNVEMSPAVLLDRQLARLSGIDLTAIRYRRLGAEYAGRIDRGLRTIEALADRLAFVRPPFDLANVAGAADAFRADVILLDYIQRIPPPGQHADNRGSVTATMNYLRQFADAGTAVIVVSAVGRTKDARGRSSYDGGGLNLASFRETSELEYGADDAFVLTGDGESGSGQVRLRHLKSRHGECRDIVLRFDGATQRFDPVSNTDATESADKADIRDRLRDLWNRTPAAGGNGA